MPAIRLAPVIAMLVSAAILTACAATNGPHTGQLVPEPAEHNAADVTFVQKMIPHHQQAVDMSGMVPGHTTNPQMLVIARDISFDQQAEIHAMTGLLSRWAEPSPVHQDGDVSPSAMPGMQGMVDPIVLNQLYSLHGNAFDSLWMSAMIGHHQGAVAMAQDEVAHGRSPDAIKMATIIVSTQQREIAYLTHLLSPVQ